MGRTERKGRRAAMVGASALSALALVGGLGASSIAGASAKKAGGLSGTVHFTAIGPLTGSYAALGTPIVQGSKAAAYLINQAGGIMGKKLVIDPVDTHGDPADAATALTQEVALNHPAALVGPITLEIHGVEPIFTRDKILDGWNGGTAAFDHNKNKYLWRCNPSDSQQAVAMAGYAATKTYKKAAMLFTTSAASQSFEPLIKAYYTKLGGKIVNTQSIQAGLSTYGSEITSLVKSKPTVIFTQLTPPTAAAVFQEMQSLNALTIPWIGTTFMAGSTVIQAIGPTVSKTHMVEFQGSTALTGAAKLFSSTYKKVNGTTVQSGANFAYDCTVDFALAMDKAKSTTSTKVIKVLKTVSNPPGTKVTTYAQGYKLIKEGKKINYTGVSGPMDFNQFHNVIGGWSAVQAKGTKTGNIQVVETFTPTQIANFIAGKGKM